MSARNKTNRLALAAIAAAGVAGAYFYFRGTFISGSNPAASAKVVPDEAVMAAYLVTDSRRWSKFQQFGTPAAQAAIARNLQTLETELLTQNNLDYEKDLQPWIGDVTLAWLPTSATPPVGANAQSDILMVVGIKNKLRAWLFARNLKSQTNIKHQEFNYKGIKISQIVPPDGNPLYQATLNNQLVLSPKQTTVEKAIDTFKGEPSLATQPEAAKLIAKGREIDNAIAHFYLPDYSGGIEQLLATAPDRPSLPPQTQAIQSLLMGVSVDDLGMRVRLLTELDPQSFPQQPPVSGAVLSRFPAETIALVSGHGMANSWLMLVAQSQTQPELQAFLTAIRQTLAGVNLNADRDVFGWMDGEFGLGLISSNEGLLGQLGFGGAVVFETTDPASAEAMRQKLDTIGRNLLPFPLTIGQRTVNGIEVREWKIPLQGALLGHGWLDPNSLFIAIGGPMVDAIATPPATSLEKSPKFQAIAGSLPTPNQGYFYLDMEKITSVLNSLPVMVGAQLSPETLAILNSVSGIGVTGTWIAPSQFESEMLLGLRKTREIANP